jgi:hypothetical protein
MSRFDDLWEQLQKDCHSIAPEVGAATGAAYGYGAEKITDSPVIGAAVEQFIGDFVTENWPHSCDLPAHIADAIGGEQSPAIDGGSQADDSSLSPDM